MGSLPTERHFHCKSVCIIGAGPSGLAAAKYLASEQAFSRIVVVEQRSNVGGLWNHVPCDEPSATQLSVPQTSASASPDKPIWTKGDNSHAHATFMSPVYDQLETNIPRGLMGFSQLDWPKDWQLFPTHKQVADYIAQYSADVRHMITFETQVLSVRQTEESRWNVTTRKLTPGDDGPIENETFDSVVVANGHYAVPFIPDVSGITTWHEQHPGIITHSKFYRKPEQYAGKKVIVVGNSASGVDIGSQIQSFCKPPMLMSQKSESFLLSDSSPSKVEKPEIAEYITENRSVRFIDGTIEAEIDAIVYCTGYFYSCPFLDTLNPPVITTGERVEQTYQHIFYRSNPTLAFLTLNQKVIPFPVAEAQSSVIAKVLSGKLSLPTEQEMEKWEQTVLAEAGDGRDFHVLKFPKDAEYLNMLHDWALGGSDDKASGLPPPHWGEEQYWEREQFPRIKKAFQDAGEERREKRTLADVGFDFAEFKAGKAREEKESL